MSIYYDWSKIEGFHCPVKIVVGQRGLGKTFAKVKGACERFITKSERFIYVVETGDMVKELTKNNGEKFWSAILDEYEKQDTSRKRYFYNHLTSLEVTEDDEGYGDIVNRKVRANVIGGTIRINGDTAGYILDMNSFGEIKRNNFSKVKTIIVDEFISEKLDKTSLENPRKIVSIIQSVARLKDVKIYLLGNSVRVSDPILARIGFKLKDYGYYKRYDENGLFAILDFVNPADYPEFNEAHNESVAGRFAKMLGEDNEEKNQFLSDIPEDRLLKDIRYKKNGICMNIVKDNNIVTIKELEYKKFAVVPFAGTNTRTTLWCMTEKEQGYKLGYHIVCNKALRQTLMDMLKADTLLYYSEIEYAQLKNIIKGD